MTNVFVQRDVENAIAWAEGKRIDANGSFDVPAHAKTLLKLLREAQASLEFKNDAILKSRQNEEALQLAITETLKALKKINLGRHGKLSTVEMAAVAWEALERISRMTPHVPLSNAHAVDCALTVNVRHGCSCGIGD